MKKKILNEDGSLNIESINKMPREERMRTIGSFTREQFQEYVSKVPINEVATHTRAIIVDKPKGVNLLETLNKIKKKQNN